MPSTSWISSCVAAASESALPKWRARFCAVTQPTSGMLRPNSTRWNGVAFDASIASITFVAERSWKPSSSSSCSFVSRYSAGIERTMPSAHSRRTSCSPTPSMSAAAMTQLISDSRPRDSQAGFGQRCITSPSGLTISASQSGQFAGMRKGLVPALVREHRADDLRDHVAGALDDHDVALADVLAVDVLLVVERRLGDGDAADLDRLQLRPRVERARAADADVDLFSFVCRGHRRPLVGARPARAAVQRAEPLLLLDRVDLAHHAVDLVVELDAPRPPTPRRRARRPRSSRAAPRTGCVRKPRSRSHSSVSHWLANSIPSWAPRP